MKANGGSGFMEGPGYWPNETSGILQPVVKKYLNRESLSAEDIIIMRTYLRQWIQNPVWDLNPHATARDKGRLARLRYDVDKLDSISAIDKWIETATSEGFDPL